MKAITLWQPWASLIALGEKQYETRSCGTKYRGAIAIHAGKTLKRHVSYWHESMSQFDLSDPPLGAIIAVARLESVILMTRSFAARMSDKELANGHWDEGRWAWLLMDVKALKCPIPAQGKQGLWEWEPDATTQSDLFTIAELLRGC